MAQLATLRSGEQHPAYCCLKQQDLRAAGVLEIVAVTFDENEKSSSLDSAVPRVAVSVERRHKVFAVVVVVDALRRGCCCCAYSQAAAAASGLEEGRSSTGVAVADRVRLRDCCARTVTATLGLAEAAEEPPSAASSHPS